MPVIPKSIFASATRGSVRSRLALAGVVVLSLGLTACGGDEVDAAESGPPESIESSEWGELVKAAEDEGELVVYSSLANTDKTFELFEQEYPDIDVKIERAPTSDTIGRLDQEIQAGASGADVAFHAQPAWFEDNFEAGNLASLQLGPEAVDAGWEERLNGMSFAIPYANPFLIGYNTETAEPVESVEELLEMDDSVSIGVGDPGIAASVAFIYANWADVYGDDFIQRLSEQNVTVEGSAQTGLQRVAAGEFDYYLALVSGYVGPLQEEGAPVAEVVPEEATGTEYGLGALSKAAHPAAAQVFINWLITEQGQTLMVENHSPASVPLDVGNGIPWGEIKIPDAETWTPEYWKQWIQDDWDPYFN